MLKLVLNDYFNNLKNYQNYQHSWFLLGCLHLYWFPNHLKLAGHVQINFPTHFSNCYSTDSKWIFCVKNWILKIIESYSVIERERPIQTSKARIFYSWSYLLRCDIRLFKLHYFQSLLSLISAIPRTELIDRSVLGRKWMNQCDWKAKQTVRTWKKEWIWILFTVNSETVIW